MNLSALRYFLEVARCNSIRRASERLHIAASAISRQISALERLWAHGLKIEAELQLVQSDIDDLKELHRGTIRITTVEGITENFLPEVLTNFAKRYPEVLFDIKIASRDKIIDALEQYETELGFVYDFSYHPSIDVMAHYEQPLYAFVTPSHPLANGVEVSLRELLKFDHVLPDSSFGISQLVRRVAKKEKAVVVPKAVSNNLQFLHRYASLNNMVVFMPVQAVYAAVKNLELAPVNLNCTPFAKRKLSIASRRQRALSPASRIFSEFAGDCFAAWQAHDEKALADACDHWWKTDVADPLNLI